MVLSRHAVDVSILFTDIQYDELPEERVIEKAEQEPDTSGPLETETVKREPYRADRKLAEAVDLALALGRPLLLQGDPGSGKTRLAYAVAYALGLPLEVIPVKSTSRAQDLLYTYDALNRLYHAQLGDLAPRDSAGNPKVEDVRNYIHLGPLGRAIVRAKRTQDPTRSVVLIDEIDKADLDFPNDLLWELDRGSFEVHEVANMSYALPEDTSKRPLVIITHNEEKALPAAFLRRCVFYHVKFPEDEEYLNEIIELHRLADPIAVNIEEDRQLRPQVIGIVKKLRTMSLKKPPGLSELLDWVGVLRATKTPPQTLNDLPYLGALLKLESDQDQARKAYANEAKAEQAKAGQPKVDQESKAT